MFRVATRGLRTLRPRPPSVPKPPKEDGLLVHAYVIGGVCAFPPFVVTFMDELKYSSHESFGQTFLMSVSRGVVCSIPAAACSVVWPAFLVYGIVDVAIRAMERDESA
jgi:hypothetical protein